MDRLIFSLFLTTLVLFALIECVGGTHAAELDPVPEEMSPREMRVWWLILDASVRYDANPYVLWTVVRREAGPGLDYAARGDLGHSKGLAQLNDRPTGLLHHFTRLGYTDPDDPVQAIDYLGQVFGGMHACSDRVTPHRWTTWRDLSRPWVNPC